MSHVVLDRGERAVHYLRPRLEINLGSIGKVANVFTAEAQLIEQAATTLERGVSASGGQ